MQKGKNHSLCIPDNTHLVSSMNSCCRLFISLDSLQRGGRGKKRSCFVGTKGTDIWFYNNKIFQVILNSTNNKLKRVAGYFWCNSVVTLWGCCPWAAYGAAAERTGQKQGQTDRKYSCRTWRCWHHSQTKTCAAVRLQSTRWRSWRNKQTIKQTKNTLHQSQGKAAALRRWTCG